MDFLQHLIRTASSRQGLRRCLPTALVVGTILSVVNQGAVILNGTASWGTWMRVAFNYLTPYVVASIGFASGVSEQLVRSGRRSDRRRD